MALVPYVPSLWHDWWTDFERPHLLLDNHFRRVLRRDDFFNTLTLPIFGSYWRPWSRLIEHRVAVSSTTTTTSSVEPDIGKFSIVLDVQQFSPHEIIVKTIGNSIIIEAKHEERRCCGSVTTTELMRRYELPKGYDINGVMSNLSCDGVLTVTAPKTPQPGPRERIVPVDRLAFPAIK